MDRSAFMQRVNTLLAKEGKDPLSWWFLSYAGEGEFYGAVVIQAHGPTEAVILSRHRKISPGGQVVALPIPDEELPPDEYRNRLLSKDELVAIWKGEMMTVEEIEAERGQKCQRIV